MFSPGDIFFSNVNYCCPARYKICPMFFRAAQSDVLHLARPMQGPYHITEEPCSAPILIFRSISGVTIWPTRWLDGQRWKFIWSKAGIQSIVAHLSIFFAFPVEKRFGNLLFETCLLKLFQHGRFFIFHFM